VHLKLSQGLPTFEKFISNYKSFYEGWQPCNPQRQFEMHPNNQQQEEFQKKMVALTLLYFQIINLFSEILN
jgi:hypothetical protein